MQNGRRPHPQGSSGWQDADDGFPSKCFSHTSRSPTDYCNQILFKSSNWLVHFILWQYFLSDDTIQVFEPPARNSGCVSGKYIQRIAAPRAPGTQRPYNAGDCYMDQKLYLFDRIFELMEADEWTLKWMEEDPATFPLANYEFVANKVRNSIWLSHSEQSHKQTHTSTQLMHSLLSCKPELNFWNPPKWRRTNLET